MKTHLVTGATGFVGGALVLELLTRTDDQIIALARPSQADAHTRLITAIRQAAVTYGINPDALPLRRVRGIAGDVTRPLCGVDAPGLKADILWHSAASLRYEDRFAADIIATNVGGTRHVLDLARRTGVGTVNSISTAYVVGRREGHMMEVPPQDGVAQNQYERSKIAAEALLRDEAEMSIRIFRPSIVVGHSRTLGATAFSGLYGFVRQMLQYRAMLDRIRPGLHRIRPLRIRASAATPLNMIPVDVVAAQAVHIGMAPEATGIYHLTQDDPPSFGSSMEAVAKLLGFPEPELVDDAAPLDLLEQRFDKRLDFYNAYIRGHLVFDRTRADAALGQRTDLRRPLPCVHDLTSWYLAYLELQQEADLLAA